MKLAQASSSGALPFFMQANPGQRFCMFYEPEPRQAARGAILYVHPFAEELNKSRRMAALQARAFAASGYGVLQIDLFGCGDSSGLFSGARWPVWKDDLALAREWLARRVGGPCSIWGLRLGALLALDAAGDIPAIDRIILWHPVFNGRAYLNQFLRMRLASQMLSEDAHQGAAQSLRQQLAGGASVEVAGYELAPELASAIDSHDGAAPAPAVPVHWFELATAADSSVAPAAMRHAERWREAGAVLHLHAVAGQPFWASSEIVECRKLLAATTALCA